MYLYFNTQCVILHTVCNLNLSVILHRTQLQNCANLEKIHLCDYGRVGRLLDRSHGNKRLLTGLMATDSYPHTKCWMLSLLGTKSPENMTSELNCLLNIRLADPSSDIWIQYQWMSFITQMNDTARSQHGTEKERGSQWANGGWGAQFGFSGFVVWEPLQPQGRPQNQFKFSCQHLTSAACFSPQGGTNIPGGEYGLQE